MNEPTPLIAEEMLSAYLDDELNPDDRATVTAAIERDERLHALVADLRQIRADIRALPAHALPGGFADRVTEACASQSHAVVVPKLSVNSNRRLGWIAGVAATAATIMVALWAVQPGEIGDSSGVRSVAKNQGAEKNLLEPAEVESNVVADEDELVLSAPEPSAAFSDGSRAFYMKAPSTKAEEGSLERGVALDSPADVRLFDWSTQRGSIDAVITVTLPTDRFAKDAGTVSLEELPRLALQDSKAKRQGDASPESETDDGVDTYTAEGLNNDFPDFGIEGDAKVVVLKGTAQQIANNMRTLGATITSTLSLKADDLADKLKLPAIEAAESQSEVETLSEVDGLADPEAPGSSLRTQTRMKSAASSASAPLADAEASPSLARYRRSVTEADQPPAVQLESPRGTPRTYRVLLIVKP